MAVIVDGLDLCGCGLLLLLCLPCCFCSSADATFIMLELEEMEWFLVMLLQVAIIFSAPFILCLEVLYRQ